MPPTQTPPSRPFAVVGLPRSRTAWLTKFLSYRSPQCWHEGTSRMQNFHQIIEAFHGGWRVADTMLALRLPEVVARVPELRTVVVRRAIPDVQASMARLGLPMPRAFLLKLDDALDVAEELPGAISVHYDDLDTEKACREVFEHCYGHGMDRAWWLLWARTKVEADHNALISKARENFAGFQEIYGDVL